MPDGLTEELKKLILSRKPAKKIILFGSRATDDFRKTSDIDIAIVDKTWTDTDIAIVHSDIEEYLPTPLKFDLVNFYAITKESLKEAVLNGIVLYESK